MIILESKLSELEPAIRECFATDEDLLEHYHIEAPASLEDCVLRTLEDIYMTTDTQSFKFFRVLVGDELAGYWGTEYGRYINLIFVKPKFRNRGFMSNFWDAVQSSVEDLFHTAVYAKNSPAVSFYSARNGRGVTQEIAGKPVVIFSFDKESVCH